MKTPMLQALKVLFPESEVDLITDSEFGTDALLRNAPFIHKVISLPKDAAQTEKKKTMAAMDYDLLLIAFDACPPFLHKMAQQSDIKKIIRHDDPPSSFFRSMKSAVKKTLWTKTEFIKLESGRHETRLNIDLLRSYRGYSELPEFKTRVYTQSDSDILERIGLSPDSYILLQPGAANGQDPTKTWAPENWIELIKWLIDNTAYPIVLCGDEGDRQNHIQPILDELESSDLSRLIDTSGSTSIDDLISLVEQAALLICHDSGTMHIADALDKNLITLFGPSDSSRTKPLRASSRIIYSDTEYRDVKYNFKSFSVKDLQPGQSVHYPMSGIKTEEVILQIKDILSAA